MRRTFTLQLYDRIDPLELVLKLDTKEFSRAMRRFAKACQQASRTMGKTAILDADPDEP